MRPAWRGEAWRNSAAQAHVTGIIEDAGRALARAGADAQYAFLRDVVPFVDRRQALGALVRAAASSAARGGPVTPQAARILFDRWLQLDRDYPGLPLWLAAAVPGELRQPLAAQRWYQERGEDYRRAVSSHPSPAPAALQDAVVLDGIRFRAVPGGTLLMGDDVDRPVRADAAHDHQPHLRAVGPFLMAEIEVTNRQFARFVAEVPRWSPAGNRRAGERGAGGAGLPGIVVRRRSRAGHARSAGHARIPPRGGSVRRLAGCGGCGAWIPGRTET